MYVGGLSQACMYLLEYVLLDCPHKVEVVDFKSDTRLKAQTYAQLIETFKDNKLGCLAQLNFDTWYLRPELK